MPKVIHFEIEGKDGKKLQSFYSGLFDWAVDANNPMEYGMVDAVDDGIGGGITASQDGKASTKIYVEVDADSALPRQGREHGRQGDHAAHRSARHGHDGAVPGPGRQRHRSDRARRTVCITISMAAACASCFKELSASCNRPTSARKADRLWDA